MLSGRIKIRGDTSVSDEVCAVQHAAYAPVCTPQKILASLNRRSSSFAKLMYQR